MLLKNLSALFKRDLEKLKKEIELYSDEQNLWRVENSIANSAGNLCLHLIGNLNTFIGATLGNTGYIRNRDLEFSLKNIPKIELIQKIEATIRVVDSTLSKLNNTQMGEEFPILVFTEKTSTEFFLLHLLTHLSYHLGQINYHRRLLDSIDQKKSH
jgi:uncharacterized damage-inducible protein DinB